jgi:hypothetical protein
LGFGLDGPFLRFDGCDDCCFFFDTNSFDGGLGGFGLVGGLVFGAEPADEAVAFFGGTFGIQGNEAFKDGFVDFFGKFVYLLGS